MSALGLKFNLSPENPCIPKAPGVASGFGTNSQFSATFYVYCDEDGLREDEFKAKLKTFIAMPCTDETVLVGPPRITGVRNGNGKNCCEVDVQWVHPDSNTVGDLKTPGELLSVNFGSQGRQIRVATSKQTWCYRADSNGGVVQDFFPGGTPVVDQDCRIIGCPITVTTKRYCEQYCVSRLLVDKDFCRSIDLSVGTLNQQPFRGCFPCEMMLTGVQANRNSLQSDWTFNFCWDISQNMVIPYRLFSGFSGTLPNGNPDPCSDPAFEDAMIFVGGFDHVDPWTHNFTCLDQANPNFGRKIVTLDQIYQYNPHCKSDYAANLGLPA